MRERWNGKHSGALALAAALAALVALPAAAPAAQMIAPDAPIATMAIDGSGVSFAPRGSFEEMTLTVGGQGHYSRQSFGTGEAATYAPVDRDGYQLPDGTYKWELVASPRLEDLNPRAFRNGKISADGRTMEAAAAPRAMKQSGVFTIQNGVMVDPNLIEAASARANAGPGAASPPSAAERAAEHTDRDGN